jgi:hypothetical protein
MPNCSRQVSLVIRAPSFGILSVLVLRLRHGFGVFLVGAVTPRCHNRTHEDVLAQASLYFEDPSMTSCMLCLCLSAALGVEQEKPKEPPPKPVEPAPIDPKAPKPAACPTPISHCDFARTFKPAPGKYEVLFIHPVKGCPVWVCFDLPPGKPCVYTSKRQLVFDYGCHAVVVQFKILCGRVAVYYD